MKFVVEGNDHFELMRNFPKVIDPKDFRPEAIYYFTFLELSHASYQIKIAKTSYQDDMLFMNEVSSKIAGKEIYGFISGINNEIILGFRGLNFIAEYEYIDSQWNLRWFEDFNIKEKSIAERRLEINSDFDKLKKVLS